jgi:beta-glucanase (GH16 family)
MKSLLLPLVLLVGACAELPTARSRDARLDADGPRSDLPLAPAPDAEAGDLSAAGEGGATPPPVDAGGKKPDLAPVGPWQLVWADEFNNQGLPDPAKWDYEVGFVRNNEVQYYTKQRLENAHVENGNLTIEARKDNYQGHAVTSASLITKGKASWTRGRLEMRAQLPTGKGSWPAFWTLGTNIDQVSWPACGEIDIMEYVGFLPDKIHGAVHSPGVDKGGSITASKPWSAFHVYAIEWFPDRIDFYFDTTKYFTYPKPGGGWPFDKSQYIILNIAVGGSWGGQQGVDDSFFPLKMVVDYVRVYKSVP